MKKSTQSHVPAKTQISLCISAVWSVFTVCFEKHCIQLPMLRPAKTADVQADLSLRWMAGCFGILHPFQQYFSHIRTMGEYEGLCALKCHLSSEKNMPPARFEPETHDLKSGALTTRPCICF